MAEATMVAIDFKSDAVQTVACNWREKHVYGQLLQSPGSVLAGPANVLKDGQANRAALSNALAQDGVVFLTGVAHGVGDSFPADPTQTVLSTTNFNPPQIAGKIVHLVSCYTGSTLGNALAGPGGGGALAFFGYTDLFQWPVGVPSAVIDLFFSCDAAIDFALAEGKSAGEAYTAAVQAYQDAHDILLKNYPDIGTDVVAMLDSNRACLCGPQVGHGPYGCADAKLGQPC
jgi:hypothetical protein